MANKFNIGDVVQLKSGGPAMTVREYDKEDSNYVICEWFHNGQREEKAFHQDTLRIYKSGGSISYRTVLP